MSQTIIKKAAFAQPLALFFCLLLAGHCTAARADSSSTMQELAGGTNLLEGGSSWYPDIPLGAWIPFSVQVSTQARTVQSDEGVASIAATVLDPVAAGHSYPKGRTPSVLYRLGAAPEELSEGLTIVWPNVDGYAAGEAHLVFALNPQTGHWMVCGSAVVSPDGQTLMQSDTSFNTWLTDYFIDHHVQTTLND